MVLFHCILYFSSVIALHIICYVYSYQLFENNNVFPTETPKRFAHISDRFTWARWYYNSRPWWQSKIEEHGGVCSSGKVINILQETLLFKETHVVALFKIWAHIRNLLPTVINFFVLQFVEAIGLNKEPFHLVGTSLGGAIAGCYAADYPSELCKLTVICPARE